MPEGVFDELWTGVGFYEVFSDLGLVCEFVAVLLIIDGEIVGWIDFKPTLFFNWKMSKSLIS